MSCIDRFGSQSVYGRVLSAKEMRQMITAENVVKAYRAQTISGNTWIEFVVNNPNAPKLLDFAEELVKNG